MLDGLIQLEARTRLIETYQGKPIFERWVSPVEDSLFHSHQHFSPAKIALVRNVRRAEFHHELHADLCLDGSG